MKFHKNLGDEIIHHKIDMLGLKFGRFTVISESERGNKGVIRWLCKCECGKEKVVVGYALRSGKSLSCGCYRDSISYSHGMFKTKMYTKWALMKNRCTNKNYTSYHNYGGRGITVCDEWMKSFHNFKNWSLKNGYSDDLQLDRRDNEKGYSPDNCRYVTVKQNGNNKRNTVLIEIDGITKPITEWAENSGVVRETIYGRLKRGITGKELITPPHQLCRNKDKRRK